MTKDYIEGLPDNIYEVWWVFSEDDRCHLTFKIEPSYPKERTICGREFFVTSTGRMDAKPRMKKCRKCQRLALMYQLGE